MPYKPGIDIDTIPADYVIVKYEDEIVAYGCKDGLKDFVGEANVDDTKVIQSALDQGGKICLVGTKDIYEYKIHGQLLFPSHTFLVGVGRRPKLFMERGSYPTRIRPKNPDNNVMIGLINLEIDGNGANQVNADQRLISPYNVSLFFVRDCYIHDAAAAWIDDIGYHPSTPTEQHYWYIQNNVFDKIYTRGMTSIHGTKVSDAYIENNVILNPADVVINFSNSESKNLHIRGNRIYGGIGGIFLEFGAGSESEIVGNQIYNCGQEIYISGGEKCYIAGNYCYGGSVAIRAVGGNHIIEGNICIDQTSRSIEVAKAVVSGNYIDNSNTRAIGIILYGVHSTIENNRILSCSKGIRTDGTHECNIVGNVFVDCGLGIYLYCGNPNGETSYNNIIANEFIECTQGIFTWVDAGSVKYNTIANNKFVRSKHQAILVKRMSYSYICNNVIIDSSAESPNTYAGIELAQDLRDIIVEGNKIVSPNGYHKYCIAINTVGNANYCIIRRNYLRDWQTAPIRLGGIGHVIKENDGYDTEKSDTATFSGDGTTRVFNIPSHGLAEKPTNPRKILCYAVPISADAQAAAPVSAYPADLDGDGKYEGLKIVFASPPAAGTNNVEVLWHAELRS